MYYVYILYSREVDRYYIGHSNDVKRRLEEHNNPKRNRKYTSQTSDWVIVFQISAGESRSEAIRLERFMKKQKSRRYIETLIKSNVETLAQLIRVPTCRD